MAHKRQRSGSWEYIVKRKILPKPITLTFHDETEGDVYVKKLESLLDAGIIPPEFADKAIDLKTISDLLREYHAAVSLADSDKPIIGVLLDRVGNVRVSEISHEWAEAWIARMKHEYGLSPSTIRKHVGSLARCFDWAGRKGVTALVTNPLRTLPKRYSTYNAVDIKAAEALGNEEKTDEWRDRRLSEHEEMRIRELLAGAKVEGRQRARNLRWQGALELIFELALESAMRMREMFTLRIDQVDLERTTIFLDKTKNGDKRQVPLTSVAQAAIKRYLDQVKDGERKMAGFDTQHYLFPWINPAAELPKKELSRVTVLLSRQFRDIFTDAGAPDLCFHDLRHEATSRFFERTNLSDIEIAKITGHKDPRMLMRYANLRASKLAERLW